MSRTVKCAKLGHELPAIQYKPFSNELGERIFDSISQDAWSLWVEHSKMLVNEYRLDLTSEKAHELLLTQCEEFLFGDSESAPPPDFKPVAESTDSRSEDSWSLPWPTVHSSVTSKVRGAAW